MVETLLTTKQIILETVEEYSDPSNRALFFTSGGPEDATCRYEATNGNKCAVGRCMTKEALKTVGDSSIRFNTLAGINFERLLKPQYKGQSLSFWMALQKLHDTHSHWSEDGITEIGIKFIKKNFDLEL